MIRVNELVNQQLPQRDDLQDPPVQRTPRDDLRASLGLRMRDALGITDRAEFRRMARLVKWTEDEALERFESGSWIAEFREAAARGEVSEAESSATRQASSGSAALASLTQARRLELCQHPSLRRMAEEYTPQIDGGRLVLGPTGIGKSTAAMAVLWRIAYERALKRVRNLRDPSPVWMDRTGNVSEYIPEQWCRAADLPNARLQISLGDGEAELVKRAFGAILLVLDDMGWESRRAHAEDVVLEVIAHRYDAGLATLVTSGLRLDQFTDRYGDAVVRRICEAAGRSGKVLDLWGKKP